METNSTANKSSVIQEILGNRITKFVMWGTITLLAVGIGFAITALYFPVEKSKESFAILQYIMGVILPLWGTWIGTSLAYYYSKDNFEAANRSVQQIVDKLTPEKKLQSLKSADVMIAQDKLIYQTMSPGDDLSKFKIQQDGIDFLAKNKIKRVIILEGKKARYVIHRDLISFYIANMALASTDIKDKTFKDMYNSGNAEIKTTMDGSVGFVAAASTLLDVKTFMGDHKSCQDVFITQNGGKDEDILGWVTNVTIVENSKV